MERNPILARLLLGTIFIALLGSIARVVDAAGDGDDDRSIPERVQALTVSGARQPATHAWRLARDMEALGPKAVAPLQTALGSANLTVRLAVAAALSKFDVAAGSRTLLALSADPSQSIETRRLALRLMARAGRAEDGARIAGTIDALRDPRLTIEAARAVCLLSPDARPTGERVLLARLADADPDARAEAALALAEIGRGEAAAATLRAFAAEPTPRGRLARAALRVIDAKRQLDRVTAETSTFRPLQSKNSLLAEVLHRVRQDHLHGDRVADENLIGAGARGMLRRMDPHSTYFTAKQRAEWLFDLDKNYGGIGAFVDFDREKVFMIVRPIYSGPAYRAGLRTDDKVLAVDGWTTTDRELNDIIKRLKGPAGSTVRLTVSRRGWPEPRDVPIKRGRIRVNSVLWEMLPGRIGFVELQSFGAETSYELDLALEALMKGGMRGLILDLRNNQGGYLPTAVQVADKFLDKDKLIVYWEGRNRHIAPREEIETTDDSTQPNYPMVVLTNRHSASASEIVAGALQHWRRAKLIGERTYGKGSVQQIMNLTSRPGDRFRDRPRANGWYDIGEVFEDRNGNGQHDDGEPFEDAARRNGVWDRGETFEDKNDDGRWNTGEPYTDENHSGHYDAPEPYDDLNGNGRYDVGPGTKLTIGRYYLPDGRSIHKERDADGAVIDPGGISPNVAVPAFEWPAWKEEEVGRLLEKDVFRQYVDARWDAHRTTFDRLASHDQNRADAYPGFDAFYRSLDTRLGRDDVRVWLRIYVRRKVMDVRGREFIGKYFAGDYQIDRQLQRAIVELLRSSGVSLAEYPTEYRPFAVDAR